MIETPIATILSSITPPISEIEEEVLTGLTAYGCAIVLITQDEQTGDVRTEVIKNETSRV